MYVVIRVPILPLWVVYFRNRDGTLTFISGPYKRESMANKAADLLNNCTEDLDIP